MGEFSYEGHRITYDEYGAGDRVLVLIHGLLMNRHMFDRLGPALATQGNRVIAVDLLGHGRSDRPEDLRLYSMPLFARQVEALLDHLGWRARSSAAPRSAPTWRWSSRPRSGAGRGPVHRDAGARQRAGRGRRTLRAADARAARRQAAVRRASRVTSLVPRTHPLLDLVLDGVRQRPGPSLAVLEGLLLGETAPHREERRQIAQPTLVVGHPADPLHPFSDSGMLAEEIPRARLVEADSILEWRISPERLDDELGSLPRRGLVGLAAVRERPRPRVVSGGGA